MTTEPLIPLPGEATVLTGDCLETTQALPDNSVHAILEDTPYGLSEAPDIVEVLQHWLAGDRYESKGTGFMGKSWDSFVPGPEYWREAYRLLKPGGYLLAFSSTRTYGLQEIAVRLAGFEVRDMLHYGYFSGFPKGIDVSRAIDQRAGVARPVIGTGQVKGPKFKLAAEQLDNGGYNSQERTEYAITGPATAEAVEWDGYNTGIKPGHEPILVARKPLSEPTVAANVLRWGVGALNVGACRLPRAVGDDAGWAGGNGADGTRGFLGQSAFRRAETESAEKIAAKLAKGRYPANVLFSHLAGCREVGSVRVQASGSILGTEPSQPAKNVYEGVFQRTPWQAYGDGDGKETVEQWECAEGCPVRDLEEQAPGGSRYFYCAKPSEAERHGGCSDLYWALDPERPSGVRPIPREAWSALKAEEDAQFAATGKRVALQCRGNVHATVKPVGIMRHLLRLCCPAGGVVLDRFAGSGSLGIPAVQDGYRPILCELDPDHVLILRARLEHARTVQVLGHGRRPSDRRPSRARQASLLLEPCLETTP